MDVALIRVAAARTARRLLAPARALAAGRNGLVRRSHLDVLTRVAERLIVGREAGMMLSGAFEIVAEKLGAEFTFNYLVDEEAGELVLKACAGLDEAQRLACARIPIGVAPCGMVAARRAPVICERIQQSTDEMTAFARGLGMRSYAGFPLLAGEQLLGTIGFASHSRDAFAPEELTLMQTVAAQAAAALERVRLEHAARASAAQLRLALQGGGAGAWSFEPRTGRAFLDARTLRLHGCDLPAGNHTMPTALPRRIHPRDEAAVREAWCACVESGGGEFRVEYRVCLPDGEIRWVAAIGQGFADEAGRITSVVGLVHDVTTAVAARENLEREAAQFDRLAERRATLLAATRERLAHASRMEALGRLAGGMAHDFNNVLQAVDGSIALALRQLDSDPAATRRLLEIGAEACARGVAVTDRLLTFGRPSALSPRPVAVRTLLESVASLLEPVLGAGIRVRVEVAADVPPLFADPDRLEAVLVNLATNARDAMSGLGEIVLAAARMRIAAGGAEAEQAPPGDHVRLRVSDTGEGMSPEVLRRVCEPFFTTKPRGKGTGLGLAMARSFAEDSGGGLQIESARGCGTTVSVFLPVASAGQSASASASKTGFAEPAPAEFDMAPAFTQALEPGSDAAAVLLVEDRPERRTPLASTLETAGHAVTTVADADAALRLLDGGFRPQALVADLASAGARDGLDLLAEARTRMPRLPALMITGVMAPDAANKVEAAENGGPFAIVRKPAAPALVRERLARVLAETDGHARVH